MIGTLLIAAVAICPNCPGMSIRIPVRRSYGYSVQTSVAAPSVQYQYNVVAPAPPPVQYTTVVPPASEPSPPPVAAVVVPQPVIRYSRTVVVHRDVVGYSTAYQRRHARLAAKHAAKAAEHAAKITQ